MFRLKNPQKNVFKVNNIFVYGPASAVAAGIHLCTYNKNQHSDNIGLRKLINVRSTKQENPLKKYFSPIILIYPLIKVGIKFCPPKYVLQGTKNQSHKLLLFYWFILTPI